MSEKKEKRLGTTRAQHNFGRRIEEQQAATYIDVAQVVSLHLVHAVSQYAHPLGLLLLFRGMLEFQS